MHQSSSSSDVASIKFGRLRFQQVKISEKMFRILLFLTDSLNYMSAPGKNKIRCKYCTFTILFEFFSTRSKFTVSDRSFLSAGQNSPFRTRSILPYIQNNNEIFCYSKRRKVLSTYEISQLVEYDGDNSDVDPDYVEEQNNSSSSSDEQDDNELDMVARASRMSSAEPEIRVYMDPPVERPDGDTDKDSGKFIFFHEKSRHSVYAKRQCHKVFTSFIYQKIQYHEVVIYVNV